MRRFSTPICIILFLIFVIQGIAFADDLNPKLVQLSEEQQKELNNFFTIFTATLLPASNDGKISDAQMVSFALHRIRTERGIKNIKRWDDRYWAVPTHDVDDITNKYFGRSVNTHSALLHDPFVEGYYLIVYGWGEVRPFARLKSLYDNGDGTFTAIIWRYSGGDIDPKEIASIPPNPNADGSYMATFIRQYPDGTPDVWKSDVNLSDEYKAIIKLVGEGNSKRYILLEYIKTREFYQIINGRVQRVPPDEVRAITN